MKKLFWIRAITISYAVLLVAIIVSANMRWNRPAFAWVKQYADDQVMHFFLVGTMALLINLSLNSKALWGSVLLQTGTLIMLLVATAEELSQLFISNRQFDLFDLAANYFGILILGSLAALGNWRNLKHNPEHRSSTDDAVQPSKPD